MCSILQLKKMRVWALVVLAAFFVSCGLPSGTAVYAAKPEKDHTSIPSSAAFRHEIGENYKSNSYYLAYSLSKEAQDADIAASRSFGAIYHNIKKPLPDQLYLLIPRSTKNKAMYPIANEVYDRSENILFPSCNIINASNRLVFATVEYNRINEELSIRFKPELELRASSTGSNALDSSRKIQLMRLTARESEDFEPELKAFGWRFDEMTIDRAKEDARYMQLYVAYGVESIMGNKEETEFVYFGEIEL